MPSKSIKNVLRSKDVSAPHFPGKEPLSSRLYQMTNPSLSQKSTFTWSRVRLRKMKRAPDSNSPGNNCSTAAPNPSKLFLMFMGDWQIVESMSGNLVFTTPTLHGQATFSLLADLLFPFESFFRRKGFWHRHTPWLIKTKRVPISTKSKKMV